MGLTVFHVDHKLVCQFQLVVDIKPDASLLFRLQEYSSMQE